MLRLKKSQMVAKKRPNSTWRCLQHHFDKVPKLFRSFLGRFAPSCGTLNSSNPEAGTAYWFSIAGMDGLLGTQNLIGCDGEPQADRVQCWSNNTVKTPSQVLLFREPESVSSRGEVSGLGKSSHFAGKWLLCCLTTYSGQKAALKPLKDQRLGPGWRTLNHRLASKATAIPT